MHPANCAGSFVAYLERLTATHARRRSPAPRPGSTHFGRSPGRHRPGAGSLAGLDRRRHIETYLDRRRRGAPTRRTAQPISASERRGRVLAVSVLLNDITEWGWPEAPPRRLVFRSDIPKLPRALPRYLPPTPTGAWPQRCRPRPSALPADALLLQRATGLRIGELLDLELDCVHEVPGAGRLAESPARQAGHRADGASRRGNRRADRPDRRAPLTRPAAAPPAHRQARRLPAHPPRPPPVRRTPPQPNSTGPPPMPARPHVTPHQLGTPTPPPWSTRACSLQA